MVSRFLSVQDKEQVFLLRLESTDGTNRLTRECVRSLTDVVAELALEKRPIVFAGNDRFFSAGAELEEISALDGPAAFEFSKMGQALMDAIDCFPAPVYAAISGYCMGGGLDLALACRHRIASPNAVFGHRGAALGLITGWGWHPAVAPSDWQGTRFGDVYSGRENHGPAGIADWLGGRDRRRSGGRGDAPDQRGIIRSRFVECLTN